MEISSAVVCLAALAQETRLEIYRHLVQAGEGGLSVGQIACHFELAGATLSFHLKVLKQAGLIRCVRQGRVLVYAADYVAMNGLIAYLTENCCQGRGCLSLSSFSDLKEVFMVDKVFHVLFLCTGNSARSIMAEGLMRHYGAGKFVAFSAGSFPSGSVNPLAVATLAYFGCPTEGLRSKSWNEFVQVDAPLLDFVVTVCDSAAGETCPLWLGEPLRAHWGVVDPAGVQGSEGDKVRAFHAVFQILACRVRALCAVDFSGLSRAEVQAHLDHIGGLFPIKGD